MRGGLGVPADVRREDKVIVPSPSVEARGLHVRALRKAIVALHGLVECRRERQVRVERGVEVEEVRGREVEERRVAVVRERLVEGEPPVPALGLRRCKTRVEGSSHGRR